MRFCVLSSGSRANATFIETAGSRLLIDCGLSAREAEKRLARIGVAADTIDAILVTHEHSDHIMGIRTLSRRHKIPVFANKETARHLPSVYAIEKFRSSEEFWVGGVNVRPFSIVHDASDPVGFAIYSEGLKFLQVTDLGRVTPLVSEMVKEANAIVLESNHDQEMLRNCDYPWQLKQRISSAHGHLSNDSAGALLSDMWHGGLTHIVLAHLSENSNRPELALATVKKYIKEKDPVTLTAGSIAKESEFYSVGEEPRLVAWE